MIGNKKHAAPKSAATTLVSRETRIVGDIFFSGNLDVEGVVQGNVIAEGNQGALLRVVENGRVEGDIAAPTVYINGDVVGNVRAADNLELAAKASVTGNVHYSLVEMAVGAQVNGALKHIDVLEEGDVALLEAVEGEESAQD